MARKKSTSQKRKSRSSASPKLGELQVADGKEQDINKIKELEELMGLPRMNPFGTTKAEILKEKMDSMNVSDLQAFAVKIGLFPSGSRINLKNKILKAFYSTAGAGAGVDIGYTKPMADPNSPDTQNLLALLKEGL
tara:strand:- start:46 stop:453 length:408 start_codon:yes stop_codon:yes gene_type:complete